MLTITIQVDIPSHFAQGVKEHLAMVLEPFGDVRVIKVEGGNERGTKTNDFSGGQGVLV